MRETEFIYDPDKAAAAVIFDQIQRRKVEFDRMELFHQIFMVFEEAADTAKLQVADLVDQPVPFCNLNEHIGRDPAVRRVTQAA